MPTRDNSFLRGVIHGVDACITALRSCGSDNDYPRAILGEKRPSSIGALAFFFSQIADAARRELRQQDGEENVMGKRRTRFPCRDCVSNGECDLMHHEGETMEGHDCAMYQENRAPWREPRRPKDQVLTPQEVDDLREFATLLKKNGWDGVARLIKSHEALREEAQAWKETCERVYGMFPTVTKVEANPGALLGFMVGIQLRLEKAEG